MEKGRQLKRRILDSILREIRIRDFITIPMKVPHGVYFSYAYSEFYIYGGNWGNRNVGLGAAF